MERPTLERVLKSPLLGPITLDKNGGTMEVGRHKYFHTFSEEDLEALHLHILSGGGLTVTPILHSSGLDKELSVVLSSSFHDPQRLTKPFFESTWYYKDIPFGTIREAVEYRRTGGVVVSSGPLTPGAQWRAARLVAHIFFEKMKEAIQITNREGILLPYAFSLPSEAPEGEDIAADLIKLVRTYNGAILEVKPRRILLHFPEQGPEAGSLEIKPLGAGFEATAQGPRRKGTVSFKASDEGAGTAIRNLLDFVRGH